MPSRKTDITSIKSNLYKVVNLQQVTIVTDSTFLLCRASEEILRERREALLLPLYVSLGFLKLILYIFEKEPNGDALI